MAQQRRKPEVSTVILGIRVTPAEREQIEQQAKAAGISASAYVRGTALSSSTDTHTSDNTCTAGAANRPAP